MPGNGFFMVNYSVIAGPLQQDLTNHASLFCSCDSSRASACHHRSFDNGRREPTNEAMASRLLCIAARARNRWAEQSDDVAVIDAFFLQQCLGDGVELRAVFGQQL